MQRFRENVIWGVFLALVIAALPQGYARAYLDPGSGSFIIQLLVAGILGGMLSVRLFWKRIAAFFGKGPAAEDAAPTSDDAVDPDQTA